MGSPAGSSDDQGELADSRCGVLEQTVRCAMGRDNLLFEWNFEAFECFGGLAHRLPVGVTSHNEPDDRRGTLCFWLLHCRLRQHCLELGYWSVHRQAPRTEYPSRLRAKALKFSTTPRRQSGKGSNRPVCSPVRSGTFSKSRRLLRGLPSPTTSSHNMTSLFVRHARQGSEPALAQRDRHFSRSWHVRPGARRPRHPAADQTDALNAPAVGKRPGRFPETSGNGSGNGDSPRSATQPSR